jgi:hypothetical protein
MSSEIFRTCTCLVSPGYADYSRQGNATHGEVSLGFVDIYNELALFCAFAKTLKEREKSCCPFGPTNTDRSNVTTDKAP